METHLAYLKATERSVLYLYRCFQFVKHCFMSHLCGKAEVWGGGSCPCHNVEPRFIKSQWNCSYRLNFYTCFCVVVCLLTLTGATSATVANDFTSSCYTVNNQRLCFYTNGSIMGWNEARQFCAGMNSTLPIIRNEHIDKVFQKFTDNNVTQNNNVWIGARAHPVNERSSWHWINGKQSGYSYCIPCYFVASNNS